MQPRRRRTMWLAATTAVAVIAVLTACTEPEAEPTSTTPSETTASATHSLPTPTPTEAEDPAEAEAEAAALAVYTAYWDAVVDSFADPTQPQDPALEANAGHTALTDAQSVLLKYRTDGIQMVGEPVLSPEVTAVELGADPTVTVADCLEVSDWQPVFTTNGESAGVPGQSTRVSYESTVIEFDGRWLVWTVTVDRDASC